jgi:uncharacterized protein YaaQ
MKLIIAILRDSDNDPVTHALVEKEFRVTMVASTGGFLRKGQTTLLIGVEDEQVEQALEVIRKSCGPASEPGGKRATIFVIKVDQYTHF